NVKDTIIGTLASILSFSSMYKEGTVIVAMAYNENKIKVSTRMAGRNPESPRNLKELMNSLSNALYRKLLSISVVEVLSKPKEIIVQIR
ncbi:hypothetical protein IID62_07840, partial [candidate division KSB1 bacterium]|nr:hypothetical protein [candidate division KSB1 bacterium]